MEMSPTSKGTPARKCSTQGRYAGSSLLESAVNNSSSEFRNASCTGGIAPLCSSWMVADAAIAGTSPDASFSVGDELAACCRRCSSQAVKLIVVRGVIHLFQAAYVASVAYTGMSHRRANTERP